MPLGSSHLSDRQPIRGWTAIDRGISSARSRRPRARNRGVRLPGGHPGNAFAPASPLYVTFIPISSIDFHIIPVLQLSDRGCQDGYKFEPNSLDVWWTSIMS